MRTVITLAVVVFSIPALSAETVLNKAVVHSPIDSVIVNRPNANSLNQPKFRPEKRPDFTLPPAEKNLLPKERENLVKIQLKGIKFTGNTVVSDEELQKISQPFINKALSVIDLEDLRQQISQYYSEKGYVNSGAILPEQQFQNGVITLQIIEGRLTEIRVKGMEWLSPSYVSKRLYEEDKPLNIVELRENFQKLLLDPLIERMNGNLIPGSQRGSSILEVDVTRARPYQLTLTGNNYRPPSIGSEKGQLSGWIRNLTGFGDIVEGSVAFSEGALGGSGGFSIPLNSYDTRFNFHFNINNAAIIEETLKFLDIKSQYLDFEFGLTQPLIQTLNRNLNLGIAFTHKKNKTELLGMPFDFSDGANNGISKDSVLRFSLDFTERMERHVFSARSTTSWGINVLSPTWNADPKRADGDFVSWLGQVQYIGKIFDTDANLILRGDVQFSDNTLMPMERFALGGRYSVRGYRENEIVRDKGYIVSAELRYPLLKPEGEKDFLGQVTIFPFMDYGAGWNRGERENINYLHSVGIGLEWQPVKQIHTEIIYAHALINPSPKPDSNLQDSGIHWQVSVSAF